MQISIVTAAYNGALFLPATLDGVLAQTFTDWEHIIVDDGSGDDTFRVAREYAARDARFRPVRKENGGVANARNFGYERVSKESRFVIFLDHDDVWKPHTLERLFTALEEHPEAVAAHGLARMTDLDGQPMGAPGGTIFSYDRRKVVGTGIVTCDRIEPTTFAVMICDCAVPTPGVVLIRREAFDKINRGDGAYFDQTVASGDDWDVWLRLCLRGDMAFVDEVLIDWRQHSDNGSKNEYVTFAAESKVRKKMSTWPELSDEQRRMAQWRYRRIYASIERRNARLCGRWACDCIARGRWTQSARLARRWLRTYTGYLRLKLSPDAGFDRPIPARLVDMQQALDPS